MTFEQAAQEILCEAIQSESDAYEIYDKAVHLVQDEQIKKWLRRTAQEELKHKAALERLLTNLAALPMGLRRLGQTLTPTNRGDDRVAFVALGSDSTFHDVCLFARRQEQQAYERYRDLAAKNEGEIHTLFEMLAQEELQHERTLRGWCKEATE